MSDTSLTESEINQRFRILANEECRHLLRYLFAEECDSIEIADVIDYLHEVTGEQRERIRVELHHNHLPRLESVGLLSIDPDTNQIAYSVGDLTPKLLEAVYSSEKYR